ncbi:MAG: hypothetical protein K5752_08010 [Succinivibrionaceae bacterium]|nr:hypothetical protein [Succinivibrionaceae bacterium]
MKKLLLAVFAFSLAFSASADDSDDVYDALKKACDQCLLSLIDNSDGAFGTYSRCKSQINLTETTIIVNNPSLNKGRLRDFTCN